MGWCGNYTYWSKRDTNKDILLRTRPSWRPLIERGELKLSQKGSNVYVLGKTANGYSWVCCYLCKREKGKEFLTKDIDAIGNHCYDFPKSWIAFLPQDNEKVQEYIKARTEYEAKQKSKANIDFGDIIECTANHNISWNNSYKIGKGETARFVVQKLNPYARRVQKAYVLQIKRKNWEGAEEWYTTNCRLSSGTFKYGISNLKVIR